MMRPLLGILICALKDTLKCFLISSPNMFDFSSAHLTFYFIFYYIDNYVDNFNMFWNHRRLYRTYRPHPNLQRSKLLSTNINYASVNLQNVCETVWVHATMRFYESQSDHFSSGSVTGFTCSPCSSQLSHSKFISLPLDLHNHIKRLPLLPVMRPRNLKTVLEK